jgi:cbb3-type cytochrome oxidase subunit 3
MSEFAPLQYLRVLQLAIVTVWVFVSVWVYWDARRSERDHPRLWGIFVFFTAFLGLYIYIRQERRRRKRERRSHGDMGLNRRR